MGCNDHINTFIHKSDSFRVVFLSNTIYSILSHVIGTSGGKAIHAEGVTAGNQDFYNAWARGEIPRHELDKEILGIRNGTRVPYEAWSMFPDDERAVEKYLEVLEKKYREVLRNEEAVDRLAKEGKISYLPADTKELMDKAYLAMIKELWAGETEETIKIIMDDREEGLLDIVSKTKNPLAISVYGGNHAFGGEDSCGKGYSLGNRRSLIDNIAKWNKKHPNQKFSLIEITPESYN